MTDFIRSIYNAKFTGDEEHDAVIRELYVIFTHSLALLESAAY